LNNRDEIFFLLEHSSIEPLRVLIREEQENEEKDKMEREERENNVLNLRKLLVVEQKEEERRCSQEWKIDFFFFL
jgi:hypothetical protein